jgi:hypothetical protein
MAGSISTRSLSVCSGVITNQGVVIDHDVALTDPRGDVSSAGQPLRRQMGEGKRQSGRRGVEAYIVEPAARGAT